MAAEIVKSEGNILRHLASIEDCESHTVPFYGILPESNSLVLAAMPLSLHTHIHNRAIETQATSSTWATTSDPIIGGTKTWLELATQLISSLSWLHNHAGVVHGDIKPGNILLAPNRHHENHHPFSPYPFSSSSSSSSFPFTPLLADFSSGQLLSHKTTPTPNTLSAVTREYTAPELLHSSVLRDPNATATTASDVFSLAVTLIVCATGQLLVYAGSTFQRQAMAVQGWHVLSHVRNGEGGERVPRMGIVDRVCERAVLRCGMGRVDAKVWEGLVKDLEKEGPRKKGASASLLA